ncbi:MAG: hypothetical protein MK102_13805 [Fuerstiella sp.]|nr:hypothetical protein [Fuerstiella sp.]
MREERLITSAKDFGLVARAVSELWPVPLEVRAKAVHELQVLVEHEDANIRLRAIELLKKISTHNIAAAKGITPTMPLQPSDESHDNLPLEEGRQRNAAKLDQLRRLSRLS